MKSKKSSSRQRRRAFSFVQAIVLFLIFAVATISGLLIFVYPLPGIGHVQTRNVPIRNNKPKLPSEQPTTLAVDTPGPPSAADLPAGSVVVPTTKMPITVVRTVLCGVKLVLVEGGQLGTRRSPIRQGVEDFVREAGAAAGINGTFFQNASLRGTDNLLIGPSLCDNETTETNSPSDFKPQLEGRPMVLVSSSSICIVPYDTVSMSAPGAIQNLLPSVTDAFLGGVWLVHNSVAYTKDRLAVYNVHDSEDERRRAFFAVMPDGRPVLGASDCSEPSSLLAAALAQAGVKEAVLLDSGFSTSLVFQQTILVTGHSTRSIPSRPVPHALILFGDPDPTTASQIQVTTPTS